MLTNRFNRAHSQPQNGGNWISCEFSGMKFIVENHANSYYYATHEWRQINNILQTPLLFLLAKLDLLLAIVSKWFRGVWIEYAFSFPWIRRWHVPFGCITCAKSSSCWTPSSSFSERSKIKSPFCICIITRWCRSVDSSAWNTLQVCRLVYVLLLFMRAGNCVCVCAAHHANWLTRFCEIRISLSCYSACNINFARSHLRG